MSRLVIGQALIVFRFVIFPVAQQRTLPGEDALVNKFQLAITRRIHNGQIKVNKMRVVCQSAAGR